MLPKEKVTAAIAEARGLAFPATEDCNSPPRHSAFNTPQEMCHFVASLRELSGGKPVGIKVCIHQGSAANAWDGEAGHGRYAVPSFAFRMAALSNLRPSVLFMRFTRSYVQSNIIIVHS